MSARNERKVEEAETGAQQGCVPARAPREAQDRQTCPTGQSPCPQGTRSLVAEKDELAGSCHTSQGLGSSQGLLAAVADGVQDGEGSQTK